MPTPVDWRNSWGAAGQRWRSGKVCFNCFNCFNFCGCFMVLTPIVSWFWHQLPSSPIAVKFKHVKQIEEVHHFHSIQPMMFSLFAKSSSGCHTWDTTQWVRARHGTEVLAQQLKQQSDYVFAVPRRGIGGVPRDAMGWWFSQEFFNRRCVKTWDFPTFWDSETFSFSVVREGFWSIAAMSYF